MVASPIISAAEAMVIDHNFANKSAFGLNEDHLPLAAQDDSPLCTIKPALVPSCLANSLAQRAHLGAFIVSVGAISGFQGDVLFLEITEERPFGEELNMESCMMSSTAATSSKGVSQEHLSKICVLISTPPNVLSTTQVNGVSVPNLAISLATSAPTTGSYAIVAFINTS